MVETNRMENNDSVQYKVIDPNIEKDKDKDKLHTQIDTSNPELVIYEYVKNKKPKVYILTPCFGGTCFINYMICLMNTIDLLKQYNIQCKVEFCRNDSLVSRARNNLVAKAMKDPETTHILFIDNDISWDPMDVIKLLMSDKELLGGIYPLKRYNWDRILKDPLNPYNTNLIQDLLSRKTSSQLKDMISDELMVRCNLVDYNVNYLSSNVRIENNLAPVKHIATGFMMIQRTTIEQMMKAYPETKYTDDVHFLLPEENEFAYALFDCGVQEGHYFSEDWLFCDRWTKLGGTIYAHVTVNLSHTGIEDFTGCYLSTILGSIS